MNARRTRILLLESDEQTLIDMQQYLEDAGFDTTITWDPGEAMQLARSWQFDLLLVGDHPPEIVAGEILRELQSHRIPLACVILQRRPGTFDAEYFYSLGASGVIQGMKYSEVERWLHEHLRLRAAAAGA
jgi:DNA-binding response OmpR family regulator